VEHLLVMDMMDFQLQETALEHLLVMDMREFHFSLPFNRHYNIEL